MELESYYEITRTADFIRSRNFSIVALQFPDQLLKDSTRVVSALRDKLRGIKESDIDQEVDENEIRLFVMADTTYGNCCIDEVGAAHVDANCVIHYGHTCLSPTTMLPAFFVLGKASINVASCVKNISDCVLTIGKPIVVLFGLEYAHSVGQIKEALIESLGASQSKLEVCFANVNSSIMNPSKDKKNYDGLQGQGGDCSEDNYFLETADNKYNIGGLIWNLLEGLKIEEYLIFWIGCENSAFTNVVLTLNGCEIVRYDAKENYLVKDLSEQRRILKRRYYLVEKAKDANIIGILVGTLGVAGYLHMLHRMKELITRAGKKAYTLAMGRPNPAKLANFPECDVFIYVSCAQTALLDSKEYMAPVITPFEAKLAFSRGSQWTGAYSLEFQDLSNLPSVDGRNQSEEARYSFFHGGYVEDFDTQENDDEEDGGALALVNATEKALQLHDNNNSVMKGSFQSAPQFFAARSYQGLDTNSNNSLPEPFYIGRNGRAAGYADEKGRKDE